jgi:DNA-binding XRE family transcriptional regulator
MGRREKMQFFDWLERVVFGKDCGWVPDTRPVSVKEKPKSKKRRRKKSPNFCGATKLALVRVRSGTKQRELAKFCGLSNTYISQIERGEAPAHKYMDRIASFFNVPAESIFNKHTGMVLGIDETV